MGILTVGMFLMKKWAIVVSILFSGVVTVFYGLITKLGRIDLFPVVILGCVYIGYATSHLLSFTERDTEQGGGINSVTAPPPLHDTP